MDELPLSPEVVLEVRAAYPLHARPAARLVQLAASYDAEVTLTRPADPAGREARATSILSLLALTLDAGDQVAIRATGADARAAADAVKTLLANRPIEPVVADA